VFRFDFLNARHGDCFLVRWDDGVMLVDGGPDPTFDDELEPRLLELPVNPAGRRVLDVVCVTHVDDDHIAGVQDLLKQLTRALDDLEAPPFQIRQVWFNSVDELVENREAGLAAAVEPLLAVSPDGSAVSASINQGRDVRNRAARLEPLGTRRIPGLLQGMQPEVDGLAVTVVAPDRGALDELIEKWRTSEQTGDASAITAAYVDRSIPNLSSIVLLVEHAGRTALLTGDARGDRILAGLTDCRLLADGEPLRVDLMKLPHHGSENNVERAFFDRIHADHYVVSADGIRHHHPSEQTLRWLVESRGPDDVFTVHLTNRIDAAVAVLEDLQDGRSFEISVRSVGAPVLSIDLGDR
jgi:hypothetical protein